MISEKRLREIEEKLNWSGYDRDQSQKIIKELLDCLKAFIALSQPTRQSSLYTSEGERIDPPK